MRVPSAPLETGRCPRAPQAQSDSGRIPVEEDGSGRAGDIARGHTPHLKGREHGACQCGGKLP